MGRLFQVFYCSLGSLFCSDFIFYFMERSGSHSEVNVSQRNSLKYLSISKFTLPSPRLTCRIWSKSLPTPQFSSQSLPPMFKSTNCVKCLLNTKLSPWMVRIQSSSYTFNHYLYLLLSLSLLIHALECKPYKDRDFYLFCSLLYP